MAGRGPRVTEFEERDYYRRPPPPEFEEFEYRRPRVVLDDSPPPPSRRSRPLPPREVSREREEVDIDVDVRTRERDVSRGPPAFLRDDHGRRPDMGPVVLRKREVETVDRHVRSPSPARVREERIVRRHVSRSPSPVEHERIRTRVVDRERVRSPSIERRRSPSPRPIRFMRRRSSSIEREHVHERIVERERYMSPSPSPSPPRPPPVLREPTIEREVITHYRDIDHGVTRARPPSPPPMPRHHGRQSETDVDVSISRDKTEVDIRKTSGRYRSPSRERRSRFHDDDLVVAERERDLLIVDDSSHRRSRSAAPLGSPVDEEARYVSSRIDSRGRMGEAYGGATKDWAIVDVPPGTERVRMDGVGGGSTDTTWSRYSGVRRTQFIPERDGAMVPVRAPSPPPPPRGERDSRLNVSVVNRDTEIDIERTTVNKNVIRTAPPPPPPPPPATKEMWTEITKDLVVREAIEQLGYEYEETKFFYYIMDYLRYDDVLRLTELSADIRRTRRDRVREIEYEKDWRAEWDRPRYRYPAPAPLPPMRRPRGRWDDERVTEVIYDRRRGPGYLR